MRLRRLRIGNRRLTIEDCPPWSTMSRADCRESAEAALRVFTRALPDTPAPDVALGEMGGMPVAVVGDAGALSGVVLVAVQLVPGCNVYGFRLPSKDES